MLKAGKRDEEVALARQKAVAARATYAQAESEARRARELAAAGIHADTATVAAAGAAAVDRAIAGTAAANLGLFQAGERPEDIAVAEAERAQVAAQLDKARADQLLLTIESPIDGLIVTKRFEEWLGKYVAHGDPLIEVDDTSSFYAEIHVPASEPLDQLAPGDRVALKSYGAPGIELGMSIERMRNVAADDELVIVTTGFTAPGAVAGIEGHARMFGRRRSLAYAMLYLPLQRVTRVKLWSIL
jgi:HlyD family secretion protein